MADQVAQADGFHRLSASEILGYTHKDAVEMPMPPVSVSRRRFFARAASATLVAPFTLRHRYQVFAQSPRQYSDRVIRLVRESLVIDMLYDLGPPEMLKEKLATADPRYRVHGTRELVADLEGQNRVFELTAVLVRRGYTDDHVRLVLGENWRRALSNIWHG